MRFIRADKLTYLKKVAVLGTVALLAGCAASQGSILEAKGSSAGKLVVFSPEANTKQSRFQDDKQNTAALFINHHFLSALQKNQMISQSLCAGDYQLLVRSVNNQLDAQQKVVRYPSAFKVVIPKNQTVYLALLRQGEVWSVQQIDEQQAEQYRASSSSENTKLLRRLPASLLECKE